MSNAFVLQFSPSSSREVEFEQLPRSDDPYWVRLDGSNLDEIHDCVRVLDLEDDLAGLFEEERLVGVFEQETSITVVLEYWNPFVEERDEPLRLGVHLTSQFAIVIGSREIPCLATLDRTWRRELKHAQSPAFLLFLVLDGLIDDYVDLLPQLDDAVESIDDRINASLDEGINRDILELRRRVLTLKRVARATREVLLRLSGRKYPGVTDACRESLGSVAQHAQVLVGSLESLREMIAGTQDAYRSQLAQKLNETMKVLTTFSVILLPMTLIAGIYGMNFSHIPELGWTGGYPFSLALMLICGLLVLYWFKRRGLV